MYTNQVKTPIEVFYLILMLRWERTAPKDKQQGHLDGMPARNSQTARLAFLLKKIASGNETKVFETLRDKSRRSDGWSYISRESGWMEEPYPLLHGWYLEGCQSLLQKLKVTEGLRYLNLSPQFITCVNKFVSGETVEGFMPNPEVAEKMLRDAQDPLDGLPPEIQCHAGELAADFVDYLFASK